ncbi:TPA: pantoate--beta-alanine ligase [Clostridium perfringens]
MLVNSTQFRYNEELDRYLRDLESGKKNCEFAGGSAIFNPKIKYMMKDFVLF